MSLGTGPVSMVVLGRTGGLEWSCTGRTSPTAPPAMWRRATSLVRDGEKVAGGLQCFAFLSSTWDVHTETSPMLYPMYCCCVEVPYGLSWPGCGGAAVPCRV